MEDYRGFTITKEPFGYTVFYEGDEVAFDDKAKARRFIDDIVMEDCGDARSLLSRYNNEIRELKEYLENIEIPEDEELDIMFGYDDYVEREEYELTFKMANDLLHHLIYTWR